MEVLDKEAGTASYNKCMLLHKVLIPKIKTSNKKGSAMEKHIDFIRRTRIASRNPAIQRETGGWDNDVYIADGRWAFRFPKNSEVQKHVAAEIGVLEGLKKSGEPVLKVPAYQPWYGSDGNLVCVSYEFIEGRTFSGNIQEQSEENARKLGLFLRQLHRIEAPAGLAGHRNKAYWEEFRVRVEDKLLPKLSAPDQLAVQSVFSEFLASYNNEDGQCLLHGDLTASNIICQGGEVIGIIDFTDAHIGDPAFDFAGIYWACGPRFTRQVLRFYGGTQQTELFNRVRQFYGLQPVFHELLHAMELGSTQDWENALRKFHYLKK
ncbi:phosphotransferase family protein [Planococcus chinensis]|uniref:Phosphotransferase family protein n=1 Tax=Planococcus chinensis TaxID=272917 RepID=A0ABW4QLN5_9BACL